MKNDQYLTTLGKAVGTALLGSGILVSASAQAAVSQAPLSLTEGVAPNMILTLDDSTSMDRTYVPDTGYPGTATRRFRAADANPMYYDPNITYRIPHSFNKNGTSKTLETSFTKAWVNGFSTSKSATSPNLTTGYRVSNTVSIRAASTTSSQVSNPADEFNCTISQSVGSEGTCSGTGKYKFKNAEFKINRTANGSCQATFVIDGEARAVSGCSQTSGTGNRNSQANLTAQNVPAYYYVRDEGCTSDTESCYSAVFVSDKSGQLRADDPDAGRDERQNFANWFSFYRSRSLATISAASLAFYDLSPDVRLTWQALVICNAVNTNSSRCGNSTFKPYGSSHRGELYFWMQNLPFTGGTPLPTAMRRAGEFLKGEVAWRKYLQNDGVNTTKNTYACRPSYHVMMTDGIWQTNLSPTTGVTRRDGSTFDLPEGGRSYPENPHTKIYYDNASAYTVADVAMNYWATDLRPTLDNKVPAYIPYKNDNPAMQFWDPRNNPATWQHMSNFIMGLGLTNSLNNTNIPWEGSTFEGLGYERLKNGSQNWPVASSGSSNNVYDLWHAAINSRGEFFSVDSPDAMVQAFNNILTRIASRKSTAAAPATSNSLETDISNPDDPQDFQVSYSYQSSFDNTEDWIGELKLVKSWRQWVSDGEGGGGFESHTQDVWAASQKVPPLISRTIKMAGSDPDGLQKFNVGNAGTQLKNWLNVNPETGVIDNRWEDRINYLRGDRSLEGEGVNQFRKRSRLLGDFLASQPALVQRAQYLPLFSNKLEGNNKYTEEFLAHAKNRAPRIYIGGNDGMLHGFDASAGEGGGKETFAFIPTAVFPNLNKLTGKDYSHHYYVDGSPEVADVYDRDAGKWKTILVGTLRAGGKGLFALDVTTPGEEKLLWEFDEFNYKSNQGYTSGMVGPGYSFPRPTIARLHNGRWAVVTGNGYEGENTNNGKAALYIIDAITGKLHKSLEVQGDVRNASNTVMPNGLSSPRLADYDGDGVADYAYAGDLQGNLWRFDLFGTGASKDRNPVDGPIYGNKDSISTDAFKVSYGGKPMFTATASKDNAVQPITAAPSLTRHPSGTGYLVILGTGKYFETTDKTGTESHAQSLYAIWDQKTRADSTGATGMPIARSSLVMQKIEQTNLDAKGYTSGLDRKARTLTDNAISYYDNNGNVTKKGWYLDLAVGTSYEGEMMIENMRVLGRDTLLVSTLVPNDDPCAHGSGNWMYALNPATGGRTRHHAFDTRIQNPDGSYTLVSAIKLGAEGGLALGQDELGITAFGETIDPDGMSGRLRGNRAGSWRMIPDP